MITIAGSFYRFIDCNMVSISGLSVVIALLLAISPPIQAQSDKAASERGRHLFINGERLNGEALSANVGSASFSIPATALPCVNCHGRDGRGQAEGGVIPSNITWRNLTKEYGGTTSVGRQYKAYDVTSMLTAITEGVDSAGNRLDSSMPRFAISKRDAHDLVAYLKIIADDFDPGVSPDKLVLGSLQPLNQISTDAANAMVSVIQARFNEVNQQGGIYGRQLQLKVQRYEDRLSFIDEATKITGDDQVFALINAFSASADASLSELADEAGLPSIAPYTQFPATGDERYGQTFYLHGGLDAQIAVLAKRAKENIKTSQRAFVFYQYEGGFEKNAKNALAYLKKNGVTNVELIAYFGNTPKQLSDFIDLKNNPQPTILFLGSALDLVGMMGEEAKAQLSPRIYLPGFFVSRHILDLPESYAEHLEMSYITIPDSGSGRELLKFRAFMQKNKLPHDYITARLFAYGATETFIEAAKRTGRQITRKKLVAALEEMYQFDVGLNKPISYGSRRRTGLLGAYVVKLDPKNDRLSPTDLWVRLD